MIDSIWEEKRYKFWWWWTRLESCLLESPQTESVTYQSTKIGREEVTGPIFTGFIIVAEKRNDWHHKLSVNQAASGVIFKISLSLIWDVIPLGSFVEKMTKDEVKVVNYYTSDSLNRKREDKFFIQRYSLTFSSTLCLSRFCPNDKEHF